MIFSEMIKYDYEQVVFCQDKATGLKAIIAIHDTTLGPALGGCRMWNYQSEEEAITDALRLARGMTYKNAVAGLNLGGGKSVIIGDPRTGKSEALFRAFGRYVESLGGRYITAEDVGTTEADMDQIFMETKYVAGLSPAFGKGGNPSPVTAYGVFRGMQAAAKVAYGEDSLRGKRVAVQGVGNVAYHLCQLLHQAGAKLFVTDIDPDRVQKAANEFDAEVVSPDKIYDVECDIFAPCALGAIIDDQTVERLKCKIVAGSANNQLKEEKHGEMLEQKGILYAPDYVINAGGVINIADELYGYKRERAMQKVETIYDNILNVFKISKMERIPSYLAADRLAEMRIEAVQRARSTFLKEERSILHFDRR
jgi:leucine dehydrogenase